MSLTPRYREVVLGRAGQSVARYVAAAPTRPAQGGVATPVATSLTLNNPGSNPRNPILFLINCGTVDTLLS